MTNALAKQSLLNMLSQPPNRSNIKKEKVRIKFHPTIGHEGLALPTLPLAKNTVPTVPEAGWASVES
jgi:hypothetical protein